MALDARLTAELRPAAVAVHDDADVARQRGAHPRENARGVVLHRGITRRAGVATWHLLPYPRGATSLVLGAGKSMGIFSRLGTLIKSNINDLITKAEDPEKMLTQVLLEMQQQLAEAKKAVAIAIADE